MMKQQLLNQIKDTTCPAAQTQALLDKLTEERPDIFDEDRYATELKGKPYWAANYFHEKANLLEVRFTKELCQHLIDVKAYLQEQGVESGFDGQNDGSENIMSPNQTLESLAIDLEDFSPKAELKKLIEERNLENIRQFLMSELPDMRVDITELALQANYVYNNLPEVFEEPRDSAFLEPIDNEQSHWIPDYFYLQQNFLNRNFTLERYLHLINVRTHLMESGDPVFQKIEVAPKKKLQSQSYQKTSETTKVMNKEAANDDFFKKALVVGGVIAAVIALIMILRK